MRRILTALALAAAACPLGAQAGLLVPASTGRPDAKVLSIRDMDIQVGIARGYARVNVRQVFENHTDSVQEGIYRFQLPATAAVGDFAVWDGLQRIPGVILEKKRARSIYEELTRQAIDPGLLQHGEEEEGEGARAAAPSLFTVAVSPIPPFATKRLEIQFQQEVPFVGGEGEFRLVLRPLNGEAPVARNLTVWVRVEDGQGESSPGALPLNPLSGGLGFKGSGVKLDQDLALRIRPAKREPLALSAFRNPEGVLPDALALAPWERPSDLPPEKDGFFLLEALPPGQARAAGAAQGQAPSHPPLRLAILFDTSLAHRWTGLEAAYGHLVRVLRELAPTDRFALIPFDRNPAAAPLREGTQAQVEAALAALRDQPLGPGATLALALAAARRTLGGQGRVLVLTGGQTPVSSKTLQEAAGGMPLFTVVTGGEAPGGLRSASTQLLSVTAAAIQTDFFFRQLLAPEPPASPRPGQGPLPFTVSGGDPHLHDVYPVMAQPLSAGALSGWVGRYGVPRPRLRFTLASPLFPGGSRQVEGALPEKALEARDLPRRWARARVDDLLARLEAQGERREWVDEVIQLSKRYKFITPYTAFLAAPRSLLRPRRIQPGDPLLQVECDPGTVAATAYFPFGLRLELARRPGSRIWEGRFLVPEGFPDGRHPVRILIRSATGARVTETKHFILDGKPPLIQPQLPARARGGEWVQVKCRADEDVVLLTARLGSAPPIPLSWDPKEKCSVGHLRVPGGLRGRQEVLFEAVDGARNHGFHRATLEVEP
jgi:Ca-activated chloride channel family protein